MNQAIFRVFRFIIIGSLAATIHWLCVVFIVTLASTPPLIANVFGFCIAFFVSYTGHRYWTFSYKHPEHMHSLMRFTFVALIGFVINESCYALLLMTSDLNYQSGLFISLAVAAISTYLFSHYWAFREN